MKSSKIFRDIFKAELPLVGEGLESIADSVMRRSAAYDAEKTQDNALRAARDADMPLHFLLQDAISKIASEDLSKSRLPAVSTLDAHSFLKEASEQDPDDAGLLAASQFVQNKWLDDPYGAFSVGDVVQLRDHFDAQFPNSRVASAFEQVATDGFAQLPDVDYLTGLAREVTSQESYEDIVSAAGLDGSDLNSVRARTYIRAVASLDEEDLVDSFETPRKMTSRDLFNTITSNRAREIVAQMDDELPMDDEIPTDDAPSMDDEMPVDNELSMNDELTDDELIDDHGLAEAEAGFPHNEDAEELAHIESPVSGEELVVELASGTEDGVPDDVLETAGEDFEDMEPAPMSSENLPDFENIDAPSDNPMRVSAQLEDEFVDAAEYSDEDLDAIDEEVAGPAAEDLALEDEALGDALPEDAGEARVTTTTIHDPSSGEELLLTLEPLNKKALLDRLLAAEYLQGGPVDEDGVPKYAMAILSDDNDKIVVGETADDGKIMLTASLANPTPALELFAKLASAGETETVSDEVDEAQMFVLRASVPAGAPINARRMLQAIAKVAPDALGEMTEDGLLEVRLDGESLPMNGLARIAKVLEDVYGVDDLEIEEFAVSKTASTSPYIGDAPVAKTPAGRPGKPMSGQQQKAKTGQAAQQEFLASNLGDQATKVKNPAPKRRAQLDAATPLLPEGPEGEDPGLVAAPKGPGLRGQGLDGLDALEAAPPGDTVDFASASALSSEESTAVDAAMEHFRNMGMSPLTALKQFTSGYAGLLEKFGEESSPDRMRAEAQVIRSMIEAFSRPALVKAASKSKTAAMPSPKGKPHGGYNIPVSRDFETNPQIKAPKAGKPFKPSVKGPDKSMPATHDDQDFGPSTKGLSATPPKSKGTKLPKTTLDGEHENNDISKEFDRMTDSLSASAPGTVRSKRSANVIISMHADTGLYEVRREATRKVVARHDSWAEALADSERRVYGTDGKVLVDEGNGELSEA